MSKNNKLKSRIKSTDAEGVSHATVGYKAMKAAPDAQEYSPSEFIQNAELPPKVDLRPFMSKVEDQGQTSSCVANAVAGAYEYWIKKLTGSDYDVSRLFVYYNARWRNGDQNKDDGSVIQLAMQGLGDFGVCSESTWPFKKSILTVKPNRPSYEEAAELRVQDMAQVPLELDAWKRSLAQGLPIVFGCVLFDSSFDECNKRHGVVPMPSPKDLGRAEHGGHSMCCVGYSDVDQVFIVRNSWGENWGDKGYCYMPYNYLMNDKFNGGDCWVFVPDKDLPSPQDAWVQDDVSVLNNGRGVDFEINPYSIAAYASVAFAFWETITLEWNDTVQEDYSEYTTYVEDESWEEIEDYSIEEAESIAEEQEEEDDSDDEEEDDSDDEEEDDSDDEEEDDSDDEEEDDSDDEEEDDSDDEEEDDSDDEEEDDSDDEEEDDSDDEEEDDSGDDEE